MTAKRGRQLRDCGTYFGTKSVHVLLYRGEYTIDVYETRTAKPVARGVHLSGANATKCPVVLSHKNPDKTGTVRIITDLSGKQVYAALRRYVLK